MPSSMIGKELPTAMVETKWVLVEIVLGRKPAVETFS